jgi:putative heme-binding domain-containing protein
MNGPVEGLAETANPWVLQSRASADRQTATFLSSLPNGEQLTGVLRSPTFSIPKRLTFFFAGHDGFPDKPINKQNFVRLRLAADHSTVIQTSPPRNDTAQKITWDLSAHAGENGYIELVDADSAGAYAWLAVGRFLPAVVQIPASNPNQISQRQQAGADLARTLNARELEPEVRTLFSNLATETEARFAAARALAMLAPATAVPLLARSLNDPAESMPLREKMAQALSEVKSGEAASQLVNGLRTAPHRLEVKIAQALASTPEGAEELLAAVESRKASPQLLLEKPVKERLTASKPKDWEKRVTSATKAIPPLDAERQKLIDQRRASFKLTSAKPTAGAKLFEQTCAVCHQIEGKGGLIGPQLDGVASRGVERIIEDVLDPNRNVDGAFRYSTITLDDDRVISGLQRREEGEVIVFADSTGKEISVPRKQIKERIQSESSLMPDNFGEILGAEDFNNLLAFLLSKGTKTTAHK